MEKDALMIRFKGQDEPTIIHNVKYYDIGDAYIKLGFNMIIEGDYPKIYIPLRNVLYFYSGLDEDPLWSID